MIEFIKNSRSVEGPFKFLQSPTFMYDTFFLFLHKLKQLKDPYAIILEDDVNIPDNFRTHWNKIYQHLTLCSIRIEQSWYKVDHKSR